MESLASQPGQRRNKKGRGYSMQSDPAVLGGRLKDTSLWHRLRAGLVVYCHRTSAGDPLKADFDLRQIRIGNFLGISNRLRCVPPKRQVAR